MARERHDDDDDGTDWLLAQLVTGRTPESEQRPQDTAAAEPPAAPEPAVPAPEAAAPAQPDLPLRPPSPRREEVLDWFSLAEPSAPETDAATRALPVIGQPGEVPPRRPQPRPCLPPSCRPRRGCRRGRRRSSLPPPPTVRVTQVEPPVGETPPRTRRAAARPGHADRAVRPAVGHERVRRGRRFGACRTSPHRVPGSRRRPPARPTPPPPLYGRPERPRSRASPRLPSREARSRPVANEARGIRPLPIPLPAGGMNEPPSLPGPPRTTTSSGPHCMSQSPRRPRVLLPRRRRHHRPLTPGSR